MAGKPLELKSSQLVLYHPGKVMPSIFYLLEQLKAESYYPNRSEWQLSVAWLTNIVGRDG
jgi:hypothetical protein